MVKPEDVRPSSDQIRAWGFYGLPRSAAQAVGTKAPPQAVGEVRYVVGWMADQMVRMGWRITLDGNESWRITTPDGTTVVSDADAEDADEETHPVNASRRLLESVGWNDATVRQVTTNLFVAGELHYLFEDDRWQVASVIDPKIDKRINGSTLWIRGIWPHPADPESPDAPLFAVLGVLDDMLWLTRLSRSQSANRVAMRGIIGISDQMTMAGGGTAEQFWSDFQASLSRAMDDPDDVAPVGLRGPATAVEPKGAGMAGLSWLIPNFPYDERIDSRMEKMIQRLAYGLPIPPEILLGMQAQSRATAFQVEANSYRAHVEPAAWTVAQVPEDALSVFLPDGLGTVRVIPDPAAILARKATVEDTFNAFDRGAITFGYLRDVLGIPESAEPSDEELEQILTILGKKVTVDGTSTDPASVAAGEGITAAASMPPEEIAAPPARDASDDDEWLATKLAAIDEQLLFELSGASEQAVVKARERIGAAIRSDAKMRGQVPSNITNDELAVQVGPGALADLGIDAAKIIPAALAATLRWWRTRLARAQSDIVEMLAGGDVTLEFSPNSATQAESELDRVLTAAVFDDNALNADALRGVLAIAGG